MSDTNFPELEARWALARAVPATGTIACFVARQGGGVHATPATVEFSPAGGLHGDRWGLDDERKPDAQITLMDRRVLDVLIGGDPARLHVPGDNIVVDLDLGEDVLPVGTRLRVGSAVLEITAELHAGCAKFRARLGDDALRWVNTRQGRAQRLRGVYARVIEAGQARTGDRIVLVPAPAASAPQA
jgi:MOSC domain-containing protein YiiM